MQCERQQCQISTDYLFPLLKYDWKRPKHVCAKCFMKILEEQYGKLCPIPMEDL